MNKGKIVFMLFAVVSLLALSAAAAFATVGTDQLADGAVTTPKIADGAVTDAKVSGVISGEKLGSHTHSGGDILDATVSAGKLMDGAVTDAKISGPISGSKISSAGLNADTVDGMHAADFARTGHTHAQNEVIGLENALAGKADVTHNHDALYQQKYGKVAVVARTGGDYTDPASAMNNLFSWCGAPSAENPCLVKIMPGMYDIGAAPLRMQSYVDIEGSGEKVTTIRGTSGLTSQPTAYTAANAEVRSLTIEGAGSGGDGSIALMNYSQNAVVSHVTLLASGGGHNTGAFNDFGGSLYLNNVTILVSGGSQSTGVFTENGGSQVILNNTTVSVTNSGRSCGVDNVWGSQLFVNNSSISATNGGSNYGIYNFADGASATVRGSVIKIIPNAGMDSAIIGPAKVAYSQLDGQLIGVGPCIGVYDSNFSPITCQ